jgi:hypothetical protein
MIKREVFLAKEGLLFLFLFTVGSRNTGWFFGILLLLYGHEYFRKFVSLLHEVIISREIKTYPERIIPLSMQED